MSAVDSILALARQQLGKPYVYGAEGPTSFDCSGLIQFVFGAAGKKLPRTAAEQQQAASTVTNPLPGDLVFWGNPAYHVALYIGNGKVISAPQPGESVKVQDVWGSPTYGRVLGLGAVTAPITGLAGDIGSGVQNALSQIFAGGRSIMLVVIAGTMGLALIGVGLYQATKPARARARENVENIL